MKISKIREAIESLNWNRHNATGGTVDENNRTNLPEILAPHIAAVSALEIAARFSSEIESHAFALEAAKKSIARWHERKGIIQFQAAA